MGATDDPAKVSYEHRDAEAAARSRCTEYFELMRAMLNPLKSGLSEGDQHKDEYKWKPQKVYRVYAPDHNGQTEVLFTDEVGEFQTAYFGGPTGKKFLYISEGW